MWRGLRNRKGASQGVCVGGGGQQVLDLRFSKFVAPAPAHNDRFLDSQDYEFSRCLAQMVSSGSGRNIFRTIMIRNYIPLLFRLFQTLGLNFPSFSKNPGARSDISFYGSRL